MVYRTVLFFLPKGTALRELAQKAVVAECISQWPDIVLADGPDCRKSPFVLIFAVADVHGFLAGNFFNLLQLDSQQSFTGGS